MTGFEIATLGGLFLGPVIAVLITLWAQRRSAARDRQLTLVRTLLNTHHDSSVPDYSAAIRLIPVEFNGNPSVIAAWKAYMACVQYAPTPENTPAHEADFQDKKGSLLYQLCRAVGLNLTESDIRTGVYVAKAYTDQVQMSRQAQLAWIRIADALEFQNRAILPSPVSGETKN